jgi:hypothetical protein
MPSRVGCLSLVSLSTGTHLSGSPPSPHRPTLVRNPSRRRSPAPLPRASDAPSFYSPPSSPPSNRALTPSMALKPLTLAINSRPPLPGALPAPIKGRGAPPAITTPHLALNRSLLSPQLLLTERRASTFCTTIAWPPQRRPSSGQRAAVPSVRATMGQQCTARPAPVHRSWTWCTGLTVGK